MAGYPPGFFLEQDELQLSVPTYLGNALVLGHVLMDRHFRFSYKYQNTNYSSVVVYTYRDNKSSYKLKINCAVSEGQFNDCTNPVLKLCTSDNYFLN